MGKPHPVELRGRVVAMVGDGHSHRATAAHFRVSVKFVNGMVRLRRETGSLAPQPRGYTRGSLQADGHKGYVRLHDPDPDGTPRLCEAAQGKPLEVWFQDEARVGQQGTLTRLWARKGTRPRAPKDRRYAWAFACSLEPCMDGSRVTRGLVIVDNRSGAAMYSASRLRQARAP